MKIYITKFHILLSLLSIVFLLSCSSQPTAETFSGDENSEDYMTLDMAIANIASHFSQNLAPNSHIALIVFDTESRTLSDYIFEEFWIYFEDNSSLVMVDRKNLELINNELDYQLSGMVSDDSAKFIGKQFGPQTLLYGKLIRLGSEYRLSVNATDVERATNSLRVANIKSDKRLASLIENSPAGNTSIDMAHMLYTGHSNPFLFTVQTDRTSGIYHDGDYMTMQIYSAQDTYFKVTHINVNGKAQVIYPISPQDNNFIKAGQTRSIPDNTRYKMAEPYGEEVILVAAYSAPFLVSRLSSSVPLSNNVIVRGLTVEDAKTQTNIQPVATAKFTYSIRP